MANVWTVKSGSLECQAEGATGFDACVAALKVDHGDVMLGLLMVAVPAGSEYLGDDSHLCSTERVLEALGITYGRLDGKPKMGELQ